MNRSYSLYPILVRAVFRFFPLFDSILFFLVFPEVELASGGAASLRVIRTRRGLLKVSQTRSWRHRDYL